jgi:hypothetical protein
MVRTPLFIVCMAALASCSGSSTEVGADAAVTADATQTTSFDAAPPFPEPGFGAISGDCDVLDDELTANEPSVIRSAFDFEQGYVESDQAMLSAGGQQILEEGTAGGSSVLSEVFAFEMLKRCESATLLKTETTISYDVEGKLTDFLAEIDTLKIGVSVTRAVAFPFNDPYEPSQATDLLEGKLSDILESTANVSDEDRWQKQILVILAYAPEHADALEEAWMSINATIRADTVVHIIVTNGDDDFVYCNGPCP